MTPAIVLVSSGLTVVFVVAAVLLAVVGERQARRAELARDEAVRWAAEAETTRVRTEELLAEVERIAGENRSGRLGGGGR